MSVSFVVQIISRTFVGAKQKVYEYADESLKALADSVFVGGHLHCGGLDAFYQSYCPLVGARGAQPCGDMG